MKTKILSVLAAFAAAFSFSGCGLTPGQQTSALVQAAGQAYGADYLTGQKVAGVVPSAVLAQYEKNLTGIANVMNGGLDPYTFQIIVQQVIHSPAVTPAQSGAVGFLSSVSSTFIRANSSPLTPEGANVEAAAQQLSAGLAAAEQQVTGIAPATKLGN